VSVYTLEVLLPVSFCVRTTANFKMTPAVFPADFCWLSSDHWLSAIQDRTVTLLQIPATEERKISKCSKRLVCIWDGHKMVLF